MKRLLPDLHRVEANSPIAHSRVWSPGEAKNPGGGCLRGASYNGSVSPSGETDEQGEIPVGKLDEAGLVAILAEFFVTSVSCFTLVR